MVLIVVHRHTVPAHTEALCARPIAPMAETEYDRLIQLRFDADTVARVERKRY